MKRRIFFAPNSKAPGCALSIIIVISCLGLTIFILSHMLRETLQACAFTSAAGMTTLQACHCSQSVDVVNQSVDVVSQSM